MRRTALLLVAAATAIAGVVVIDRLNDDRQYRGFLASGDAALAAGHPYLAVEAFSGALAVRRDSVAAHYRRGEAYAALGQLSPAERDLREARRLAPDAPEPLEALGRLSDRRGDHSAAADWYTLAAERLHDTDARLLYALALARYRTGALPAARDAARRAAAVDDRLAEAHYLSGLIARDLGATQDAVSALEQAVRRRPSLAAAREELAAVYGELGRTDARTAQLQALAAQETQIDRHLALALAHLDAGRHEAALGVLASAEELAPGDSRIALAVGRIHLAQAEGGDTSALPAAIAALERALGGTARRSEGLALYGRALHLSGDAAHAERLLDDAIRTTPVDPRAFGYLADAAETLQHWDVARDALLSLERLEGGTTSPDRRRARARRIGSLSFETGDVDSAARYLATAIDAGDHSVDTASLLVRSLVVVGRIDEARSRLNEARSRHSEDEALRRLEQTLASSSQPSFSPPAS